ncbi:MAG: hypothetical protein ACYSSI_09700 [Planctomycetota bacterium]|jgi:tRNA nucleotidyltransferase/poly(A) polymerase
MRKIRKDYNLKIVSAIVASLFLCNATIYSYPITKDSLRVPIGTKKLQERIRKSKKIHRKKVYQNSKDVYQILDALKAIGKENFGDHGLTYSSQKRIVEHLILGDKDTRDVPCSSFVTRIARDRLGYPISPKELLNWRVTKLSEGAYEWIIHFRSDNTLPNGEPFQIVLDIGKHVGPDGLLEKWHWPENKRDFVSNQYLRLKTIREEFIRRAKEIGRDPDYWTSHVVKLYGYETIRLPLLENDQIVKKDYLEIAVYAAEVMESLELNIYLSEKDDVCLGTLHAHHSAETIGFDMDRLSGGEKRKVKGSGINIIYDAKTSQLYLEEEMMWIFMARFAGVEIFKFSPNSGDFNKQLDSDVLTLIAAREGKISKPSLNDFVTLIDTYISFNDYPRNGNRRVKVFSPSAVINGFFRASIEWHDNVWEGFDFAWNAIANTRFSKECDRWSKVNDMIESLPPEKHRNFIEGLLRWRVKNSKLDELDVEGYITAYLNNSENTIANSLHEPLKKKISPLSSDILTGQPREIHAPGDNFHVVTDTKELARLVLQKMPSKVKELFETPGFEEFLFGPFGGAIRNIALGLNHPEEEEKIEDWDLLWWRRKPGDNKDLFPGTVRLRTDVELFGLPFVDTETGKEVWVDLMKFREGSDGDLETHLKMESSITFNQIVFDFKSGRIIDINNGLEDLKNRVIRVSNPENLRSNIVIRIAIFYIRLNDKYGGFTIEKATKDALLRYVEKNADLIAKDWRVFRSMYYAFSARDIIGAFKYLEELGLLYSAYFPELKTLLPKELYEILKKVKGSNSMERFEVFLSLLPENNSKAIRERLKKYSSSISHIRLEFMNEEMRSFL